MKNKKKVVNIIASVAPIGAFVSNDDATESQTNDPLIISNYANDNRYGY